jgi:hypothetical protein
MRFVFVDVHSNRHWRHGQPGLRLCDTTSATITAGETNCVKKFPEATLGTKRLFQKPKKLSTQTYSPPPKPSLVHPNTALANPNGVLVNPADALANPGNSLVNPPASLVNPNRPAGHPAAAGANPNAPLANPRNALGNPNASLGCPKAPLGHPKASLGDEKRRFLGKTSQKCDLPSRRGNWLKRTQGRMVKTDNFKISQLKCRLWR